MPHGVREPVTASVRTTSAHPIHASAPGRWHDVTNNLSTRLPAAEALLEEADEDILAHKQFLGEHQRRLHSANPIE